MSGSKRITVDRAAWEDVRRKAARLRDLERELPAVVAAVRHAQQEQSARNLAEIQARNEEFSRSISRLSDQAKRLEQSTSTRIQATIDFMMGQVEESSRRTQAETRKLFLEQQERLDAELVRERQDRQRELGELRGELGDIRDLRQRALALAKATMADARLLRDTIAIGLPHERFAPGRLEDLSKRLAFAEGNISSGLAEAALAQAQELYMQLGELRTEVELKDAEQRAAQLAAIAAVTALREEIKFNTVLQITEEDTGTTELDVDFWSEGELAAIRAEAEVLDARVHATSEPPGREEFCAIAEEQIPELETRLTDAVAKARTRQWASQLRVNLAEMVVDVLEEIAGYAFEGDATYAGEDQRAAFYSKLRHMDDSEIVIEVAPDETGESCVLRILSYESGTPDESERVARAHAVADSLRARGLPVGPPSADPTPPDPMLTDFGQLRRARHRVPDRT